MIWWEKAGEILVKHEWLKIKRRASKYRPGGVWLDNIFTIDTETTSAFLSPDGELLPYRYGVSDQFYRSCEKYGWMYIWMIGVDDLVFYGRSWAHLTSFLELMDDLTGGAEKIFYCHNLSFDWQFLRNALKWDSIFARKKRKVLTADSGHYHFRCSYYLVNQSLDSWAKSKKLNVTKAKGQLNYLKIRTPLTELTPAELDYCERDILVMFEGLKQFREKYGAVYKIPLTQTGETRTALADIMKNEKRWLFLMRDLLPHNLGDYRFLMDAFFGGDVHANYYMADRLLHWITSVDFASSYPWVMLSEKYPISYFTRVTKARERFMNNPNYCYIVVFDAFGIKSKLHNTFLSRSRCSQYLNAQADNGRIVSADYVQCHMTNVDFEMFREFYEIERLEILDFKVAVAGYLNSEFCRYILKCYKEKTAFKGLPDRYGEYMFSKQIVNGLYGDQVTRDFEGETIFDCETGDWDFKEMTADQYLEKSAKKKRVLPRMYKTPQIGIFVTAYARRNLWRGLIKPLDHDVAYFDTDCAKFRGGDPSGAVSSYNLKVLREHYKIAERLGVDVSELSPLDPKGKAHPIGLAEKEACYEDFKTLGAKKYACKEPGGPIEITIAGVPKGYASELFSVDDLTDDLKFDPKDEDGKRKSIVHYMDDQPELDVDGWHMSDRFGICLQPTGYRVSITADYLALIAENREDFNHDFDFLEG